MTCLVQQDLQRSASTNQRQQHTRHSLAWEGTLSVHILTRPFSVYDDSNNTRCIYTCTRCAMCKPCRCMRSCKHPSAKHPHDQARTTSNIHTPHFNRQGSSGLRQTACPSTTHLSGRRSHEPSCLPHRARMPLPHPAVHTRCATPSTSHLQKATQLHEQQAGGLQPTDSGSNASLGANTHTILVE